MTKTLKDCFGEKYLEFLSLLKPYADSVSIVVHDVDRLEQSAKDFLAKFKKLSGYRVGTVSEWPGTVSAERVSLHQATFDAEAVKLLSVVRGLEHWIEPSFPEDLTFYSKGKPIFISTTHERDFYFAEDFEPSGQLLDAIKAAGLKYE